MQILKIKKNVKKRVILIYFQENILKKNIEG
jgi:hypothetical protein